MLVQCHRRWSNIRLTNQDVHIGLLSKGGDLSQRDRVIFLA